MMGLGAATAGIAAGLGSLGIGEATAGILAPALLGAGVGAGTSALTGGNLLTGALTGGLGGGAIGGLGGEGGFLDTATGGVLGATGSDALLGAAAGALGSGITGGNALTGSLTGAASGALQGALSGPGGINSATAPASGSSAAGLAGAAGPNLDLSGSNLSLGTDIPGAGTGAATTLDSSIPGSNLSFGGAGNVGGVSGAPTGSPAAPSAIGTGGTGTPGLANVPAASTLAPTAFGTAPGGVAPGVTPQSGGLLSNLQAQITKNPLSLLAAAPLAKSVLTPNSLTGESQLKAQAGQLGTQGAALQKFLTTGQLPAGAQGAVDLARKNAEATIRSKYASMGQSGSTAEANELANLQVQSQAAAYQQALGLFQQGLNESGISSDIYRTLLQADQQQSQATGQAISNFAAALAGTTPKAGG